MGATAISGVWMSLPPQASSAGRQTGVKGFGKTHDDS